MEKIKNKGKVLVGVLVAISLLLVGYIIYDKFINNHSNINVIDAYSYVGQVQFDDSGVCKPLDVSPENVKVNVNVKIPKINSTRPNAILLNQEILNDFNDYVNIDKRGSKFLNVVVSYETVVKGDYIDIIVKESSANPCGSGGYTEKKYTYDMKNDSIIVTNTVTDNGVVSAYSYSGQVKYTGTCTINDQKIDKVSVDVKIPKINSTKKRALSINQQILDDFSTVVNIDKNGTSLKDVVVTYESIIKGDYLYIYVKGSAAQPCGSGYHVEKSYYYDMKNDKIMMNKEAFEKVGLTIEDLKDVADDDTIDFDTCNKNSCGCGLKIANYNLVPYYIPYCS